MFSSVKLIEEIAVSIKQYRKFLIKAAVLLHIYRKSESPWSFCFTKE